MKTRFGSTHFWLIIIASATLIAWQMVDDYRPLILCGTTDAFVPYPIPNTEVQCLANQVDGISGSIAHQSWRVSKLTTLLWRFLLWALFVAVVFAHHNLRSKKEE